MPGEFAPKPSVEEMSDNEVKQGLEAAEEMKQPRDTGTAPEAKVETGNDTVVQFSPGEPLRSGLSYEEIREEMKRRHEEQD